MTEPTEAKKLPIPRWAGVLIVLAVAGGIWFVASRIGNSTNQSFTVDSGRIGAELDAKYGTKKVTYKVDGSPKASSADLTMTTPGGNTKQENDVSLPLTNQNGKQGFTWANFGSDESLYVSAQNKGSGEIRCKIVVDGVTVAEETSSGEYAIVTCSA